MEPYQIINHLNSDNSRLFKESMISSEAANNNINFFKGLNLCLNQMITFGVKQIPLANNNGTGLLWEEFEILTDKLQSRNLTGNAARDAINVAMNKATIDQWNLWYRRILIKDLRCGVSIKTVNKAAKKYKIPVFEVQLAHDSSKYPEKISGKKLISSKLDGVRCISIVYPNGEVVQFSRNGKELLNFTKIKDQFSTVASSLTEPYVFDGEVMSSTFQDMMKQVRRKTNVQADDSILYLFDCLPLKDFEQGRCNIDQSSRSDYLENWYTINQENIPNINILSQELVDLDSLMGKERFKEINKLAIALGFEGIMLKCPTAIYDCKRSFAWLKLKPVIEVTLTVASLEEGTGKNEGRLGALVCHGTDDDKFITVNVGSGFSDEQRDDYWTNSKDVIGQLVEIRADVISQNKDGTYSLRFPRFRGFRGFSKGEKI